MTENKQNIYNDYNILYNSLEEYELLCTNFKNELPELISQYELDDWSYDWNENGCGIHNSCNFENVIEFLLLDLTKRKNHQWASKIAERIGLAIRGIIQAAGDLKYSRDTINCAMCDSNNSFCIQSIFMSREICKIFIVNTVNNIIFNEKTEFLSGELEKIRIFKCPICDKIVRLLMKSASISESCISCFVECSSTSSDE